MASPTTHSAWRVVPIERADLPTLLQIWHDSFADDRHTLMKLHEDGNTDFGEEMPGELLDDWFEDPDIRMMKAVRADGGIGGFTNWGTWNFDGAQTAKDPDAAFDAPVVNPKPVDASMPLLRQMRNHTSGHMFAMADRLNRAPRTVYAMTLAVAPRAQGTGAGHALVGWAARFADEHGACAWIHLSDSAAGVRVLEKHGFAEVNRLAVDLDAYATKSRPDGGVWGTYTFRYFRREAQATAAPGAPSASSAGEE